MDSERIIRMIQLIASDLDGTLLLNGSQELEDGIFPVIQELTKRNILFVAASGRQYPNLRRLFAPVADQIAYIAENGSYVVYKGNVLFQSNIKKELCDQLIETILSQDGCEVLISSPKTSYLIPKTVEFHTHVKDIVKNDVIVIKDASEIKEDIIKVAFYHKDGINDELISSIADNYKGIIQGVGSGNLWYDFMNPNVNKGNAIKILQKQLNINTEHTMAFGDSYNDVEMLKEAKYSYAAADAVDDVIEVCKHRFVKVEDVLTDLLKQSN